MAEQIILKTAEEIELIRNSSLLVGKTLGELKKHIQPGVSTLHLDQIAETFIRDHGGVPAFKDYNASFADYPFPGSLCTSVNEQVVHGIPSDKVILQNGDLISIDCGVLMNGYFGDSAYTFAVGEVSSKKLRLMQVTKESLYKGIEMVVAGNRIGDISYAVQKHAERFGYSVVREMVGHGLGVSLHEAPEVPNHGKKRSGPVLVNGMVIAIEPMINMGKRFIKVGNDGWTVMSTDRQPSAHYEHSVAIVNGQPEILSTFAYIEN
ncbi:MAG: type I methionyl aminopeptidase [Bacteroidia bacterium]|nr:type I methionyl aminopeptidase [Bacteroidia bacterium]